AGGPQGPASRGGRHDQLRGPCHPEPGPVRRPAGGSARRGVRRHFARLLSWRAVRAAPLEAKPHRGDAGGGGAGGGGASAVWIEEGEIESEGGRVHGKDPCDSL